MMGPFCGTSVKFPCKGCTERHQACWSDCERYQKAKAEQDELNRYKEKQRQIEDDFQSVRKNPRKWRVEEMGKHSVRSKKILPPCKYNSGVHCPMDGRRCDKCGWNPAVAKRRKAKVSV